MQVNRSFYHGQAQTMTVILHREKRTKDSVQPVLGNTNAIIGNLNNGVSIPSRFNGNLTFFQGSIAGGIRVGAAHSKSEATVVLRFVEIILATVEAERHDVPGRWIQCQLAVEVIEIEARFELSGHLITEASSSTDRSTHAAS